MIFFPVLFLIFLYRKSYTVVF